MTGAEIRANQLSIGPDRDVVYKKIKEKGGGVQQQDGMSDSLLKRKKNLRRVPN